MLGLGTALLALGAQLPVDSAPAPAFAERARPAPNLVLLLVDDLGWGDLGCYGERFHRTPAIDSLAADGTLFTDAYATSPVCSPSRASLMTGKYPARIRITDWIPGVRYPRAPLLVPDFDQEVGLGERTLAEALSERGYATWHVGKWHLGREGFWPLDQGFEVNVGGHSKGAPGSYHHPYEKRGAETDWSVLNLPPGSEPGDYLTDFLTDRAVELIGSHAAGGAARPFFLHMSYYSVHTPLEGRSDLVEAYRERARERPEWGARSAAYAAMVHAVDESVGRILESLEANGLADDTLVVFTSDNGGYLGHANLGGLRGGKGCLYEGGLRVPLLVRWPGRVPAGASSAVPVNGADLFATLLDAAGSTAPRHDGLSQLDPWLEPARKAPERDLFWHYPHYHTPERPPGGVVRRGDWKLIQWYEDGRRELFDLGADPGEQTDLAARQPERAAELGAALEAWLERVSAQRNRPNPEHDPGAPFAGGRAAWGARSPTD